ncbi:MAG: S46 family peptidase [Gemmatimonadaceae bacterium]
MQEQRLPNCFFHAVALSVLLGGSLSTPALAQRTTSPKSAARTAPLGPATYVKEAGTMWTFDAPPLDYWKKTYNFTPDSGWLDHVRLASVRLPGCSSSFVSADGLVLTNHHCARACVASASPRDTDYSVTGFIAASLADERKCATLYVDQLESMQDVTSRVRGAVTAKATDAQVAQRDAEIDSIENDCKQRTGLICQVVTLYQGGMYSLYRYRRFSDVRLVMVPEEEAAFFGGDPDNFTFPRYDLDMALLRVYEHDAPMQVKDYLHVSMTGPKDSDLVFVVGNPGSTGRLLTLAQMQYLRDVQYPLTLTAYARGRSVAKEISAQSPEQQRANENLIFGIENSIKAVTGYRSGLLDSVIMARKAAFEHDLRARVNARPALRAKYGGAWDAIAHAERERAAMAAAAAYHGFSPTAPFGSQLLNWAGEIVQLPAESARADSARLPRYRGKGLAQVRTGLESDRPVNPEEEKLALAAYLTDASRALPATDPVLRAALAGRSPEVAAEALINGTHLGSVDARKALVEGGAKAVASSADPLIELARRIDPLDRAASARVRRLDDVISANAEKVGQALFAVYGTKLPPDATFTLRISDGTVKGYPYNGTIAPYRTSFYGMFGHSADFNDTAPFHLPERWMQARDSLDLAAPLDFVSTNDIIGGNSGSPVINRNGELVGLIFDENIESLPNRFIFTDDAARSVSVDSRAIIEALGMVYHAPRLVQELVGRPVPQKVTR